MCVRTFMTMGRVLVDITTLIELRKVLASGTAAVVHFWAGWCEPCAHIDKILLLLAEEYPAKFIRVEAEEATDISVAYDVAAVPLLLFFQGKRLVDRLEGADVAAIRAKVRQHCIPKAASEEPHSRNSALGSDGSTQQRRNEIHTLVNRKPIMLLMKGTPENPRCGFSSKVVKLLQKAGVQYGSFDILSDESIRQAAKEYSDWPSYPQLYVNGDLLGGCDIAHELDATGELEKILAAATKDSAPGARTSEEKLKQLINSHTVMVFIKGSPDAPRCGFSAKMVQALRTTDIEFGSFDILQDQEVRQGLKILSDWPTFPQLYIAGELLGGSDIVLELLARKQLRSEIDNMQQKPRSLQLDG